MALEKNVSDLLYLVYCSLNGKVPDCSFLESLDNEGLFSLARKQSLGAIAGHALVSAGTTDSRWQQMIDRSLYRIVMFDAERSALLNFLEETGVWYMPLKGTVLMNYFPQVYMRQFSDNDILYDRSFQKQVREYFVSQGYEVKSYDTSHHDTYHKKPVFNFEMHTSLYSATHNQSLVSYYKDVKNRLIKDEDNNFGYHFSDNDFYIHTVSHAYKHYCNGGMGLKLLIDCYVCCKKFGDSLDFDYIEKECEKAGFSDFEKLSRNTAIKAFGENRADFDKAETELLNYCIDSGTYGTQKNRVSNSIRRNQSGEGKISFFSKVKYFLGRLFPPPRVIYQSVPFTRKCKLLLPIGYIVRIVTGLFRKKDSIKSEIKEIKNAK